MLSTTEVESEGESKLKYKTTRSKHGVPNNLYIPIRKKDSMIQQFRMFTIPTEHAVPLHTESIYYLCEKSSVILNYNDFIRTIIVTSKTLNVWKALSAKALSGGFSACP